MKLRNKEGQWEPVQKHVMILTLKEAFQLFQTKHPLFKVGFSTFAKLRPKNVTKVSETSKRTCLCMTCCNVALKVEVLGKFSQSILLRKETETDETKKEKIIQLENAVKSGQIKFDKAELAKETLCKYDGEFAAMCCLERNCANCGVNNITAYLAPLSPFKEEEISWVHWGYTDVDGKRKVRLLTSATKLEELIQELEENLKVYPVHRFRATWQQQQFIHCINTLDEGEVLMAMDYAENFSCSFQDEVQSAHWEQSSVTIHPTMNYYQKKLDNQSSVLVKHAVTVISDDLKHDAHAVTVFVDRVLNNLKSSGVTVNNLKQFSDGSACQYKGKIPFYDISNAGIPTERNFYETSHGKSVCDGLGAIAKQSAGLAVLRRKVLIRDAEEFYNYCDRNLTVQNKQKTNYDGRVEVSKREYVNEMQTRQKLSKGLGCSM